MNDDTSNDGRLHETAGALGERAAVRIDVEATAQAVVRRLREQPAARPPRPWAGVLRIAALLAVLVGGGLVATRTIGGPRETDAALVDFDLSDLSADDLRQLLATLDETLSSADGDVDAGLEGLTEQQLREVLRTLEG